MARRTLALLLAVFAVNHLDRQLVAILIEPIKRDLGLSDTSAGLLYGFTFALFFAVAGIPIARYADRTNRTNIIAASLVLFSAMTAVCAGATSYLQLLLARTGVAIGEAGTNPPSLSIITDLYPLHRRSSAMAILAIGPHLGILLSFMVGGVLAPVLGWRQTFLIAGAAGLVFAVLVKLSLTEPARPPQRGGTPTGSLSEVLLAQWRCGSLRQLFAGGTVCTIATSALLGWLPAFVMRSHGLSITAAGTLLALALGVLGGVGTGFAGWLADRLGRRDPAWRLRVVTLALLVQALCWGVAFLSQNAAIALAALSLGCMLIGFHLGPTFAMVQSLTRPDLRALMASLLLFAANLVGLGAGPLVVGVLSDLWATQMGTGSLAFALLVVPPLYLWSAGHYHAAARTIDIDLRAAQFTASAVEHTSAAQGDALCR